MTKTVADIMTRDPVTVKPETALKDAIKILVNHNISGLPVVDNQDKLVGVVSESDILWQETGVETPLYITLLDSIIYLQNPARHEREVHKALGQTVGEVMSDRPITITAQKSVKTAAQLMHDRRVRRLPVVNEESGKLIGVITRSDIVRSMIEA